MQNLFWIIQPCYINKQHHQGMMCVWIKGHLSAKSVKIIGDFYQVCSNYAPGVEKWPALWPHVLHMLIWGET